MGLSVVFSGRPVCRNPDKLPKTPGEPEPVPQKERSERLTVPLIYYISCQDRPVVHLGYHTR